MAFAGDAPDPAKTVVPVGDVAVTAMRSNREVLETPGHVTVLDREDIEESGVANVAELLRRQGGLYVTNTTSSRIGYSIEPRGFENGSGGGSSLLVMIDGRRINEPSTSQADWSLLHLDDIERIEILRGPASALYGDNAVGGVVNIITRTGEGPASATGTARFSRHRGREGSLRAGASAGPLSLSVFADRFRSDGYRDQSQFRVENYKGNFRAELGERGSLALRGGWSTDDRDTPGPLTEAELASDRRQVDPDSTGNRFEIRSRFVDGVLEYSPLDDLNLEIQGYYTRRSDRGASSSAAGDFVQDFTSEAIGINTKAQLDREIAGRPYRLVAGVDLLREDRDGNDGFISPFFNSRDRRRTSRKLVGAFLQNELEILDGLILSAGIRHDRADYHIVTIDESVPQGLKQTFEPTHSIWSPRFGALYRITERVSAYANYSRGFRFPNLAETSGPFSFNPEVEPQRSHGWELGVKHHGPRFRGNFALYRMDVVDEIVANSDVVFFFPGPTLGVQTVNLDRVRHQGFETSWSLDVFDWFEVHGNYTYDDTRVRRDDVTSLDNNHVPITPRHRGLIGFLAHLPFWLEFGMDGQFVGERYATNDWGQDFDKIDDYRRWDAHVAWRPKVGEHVELSIFADVQNFMGRRYEETGGRPTFVPVGGPAALAFFPAPEREWTAGFSATVRQ
ncbi:MAG: TonB-dependent receptor [Deltaproteobacteria bacterium]|nr:TonB-dependent receptor [Deltaproteobacteria bacterium]